LSIHFDLLTFSPAAMRRFFSRPISLLIPALFDSIRDECSFDTEPMLLCNVKALVYVALGKLMQPILREIDGDLSMLQDSGRVTPAVRHIEEHLADALDTRQLAELCHLSCDHFIRVFRQHVGSTPAQYVIDRRVAVAMQRLLFTPDSIEKIAEMTGFPDRFYFSRVFSKRTGQSPAAYRRETRI
jgi:AraC-like DNA-binding protein